MSAYDEIAKLRAMLARLEWVGVRRGQGSGPMSSGGDGRSVRSCPLCRGIDPSDAGRVEFISEATGHRDGCELASLLSPGCL